MIYIYMYIIYMYISHHNMIFLPALSPGVVSNWNPFQNRESRVNHQTPILGQYESMWSLDPQSESPFFA